MDTINQAFETLRTAVTFQQSAEKEWQPEAIKAGLTLLETFLRDVHDIAENARNEMVVRKTLTNEFSS